MMMPSTLVMPFGTSKVDTPFSFVIAEHLSTPGDHERSTTRRILTSNSAPALDLILEDIT